MDRVLAGFLGCAGDLGHRREPLLWRGESATERSWIYEYGGQQLLLNVYFGAFFVPFAFERANGGHSPQSRSGRQFQSQATISPGQSG